MRLASKDTILDKVEHYADVLIALLPQGTRSQADFEAAARVLDDLSRVDHADLDFLGAFPYSPSIPVEQFVLKPSVEPMPDIGRVRASLKLLLPTAMRLQGMGILIVAPKPLTWVGSMLDVDEYTDFLRSHLHLSNAGKALVIALNFSSEAAWNRNAGS